MTFVEIHIKGKLDASWSDWFEGLEIRSLAPQDTQLSGTLADKAAIFGVIAHLSSLGLELISIQCREKFSQPEFSPKERGQESDQTNVHEG